MGMQIADVSVLSLTGGSQSGFQTSKERYEDGKDALGLNPAKGIALLKELANNGAADPFYRAKAVNALTEYYVLFPDKKTKEKLFSGDPWSGFYVPGATEKGAKEDAGVAARKAFEWSYSMFPTGLANMQIAWWYVRQIRDDSILGQTEKSAYLGRVKQRILQQDDIVAHEIKRDLPLSEMIAVLTLEGINNAMGMYLETKDPQYKTAAIKAYEKAIRIDPLSGLDATFHYANLLRLADGEAARSTIQLLMDKIIGAYGIQPEPGVFGYFRREQKIMYAGRTERRHIKEMALFYPRFANLLKTLGWSEQEFKAK